MRSRNFVFIFEHQADLFEQAFLAGDIDIEGDARCGKRFADEIHGAGRKLLTVIRFEKASAKVPEKAQRITRFCLHGAAMESVCACRNTEVILRVTEDGDRHDTGRMGLFRFRRDALERRNIMFVFYFFLVLDDLSIQLVDQEINRRVHVRVLAFDKNVFA